MITSVRSANSSRPERQIDYSQGRALEEVSPPRSEPPRDLREVPNDEISVFEGETPLKSADSDIAIRLNPVAEVTNYK